MEASHRNPKEIDPANVLSNSGIPPHSVRQAPHMSLFTDDNSLVQGSLPYFEPRAVEEADMETGADRSLQGRRRDPIAEEMLSGSFLFVSSHIEFVWYKGSCIKDGVYYLGGECVHGKGVVTTR